MTQETERTPRWVKVFGIVGLVLVLLVVAALLIGGKHGPGRHTGGVGDPSSGPSVAARLAQQR